MKFCVVLIAVLISCDLLAASDAQLFPFKSVVCRGDTVVANVGVTIDWYQLLADSILRAQESVSEARPDYLASSSVFPND